MSTGPAPRTSIRRLVAESDDLRLTHLLYSELEVTTHRIEGAISDVEERVTELQVVPIGHDNELMECPHIDPVRHDEDARPDTEADASGKCCGPRTALLKEDELAIGGLDLSHNAELDRLFGKS